ncbi:MAG: Flp pilus assembly protein CpaB [Myxococcaceae bacterium]|nr:Flp pilus assembly protein CpaB [Myxococcaceae bacterium]
MLKGKTPLLIALLLAGLGFVVAWSAVRKQAADAREGWKLTSVLVATTDLSEGTVVTSDMVASREVPEAFVTSSVVRPDQVTFITGQKILVPVQTGDPLLYTQFETQRTAERLSTKVQKQARAVTIDAAKTTAVGGWVRPNDHVDVIGIFKDPQTNESVAVTLMENVMVLATGKITGTTNVNLVAENQREYSNVSLLLSPEQVEVVVLAAELGSLSLSLRNPDDNDLMQERGRATIGTLLSGDRMTNLDKKRIKNTLEIFKGTNTAEPKGTSGN